MEILTLIKANIQQKKGAFVSVAVLTFLIVTVAVSVLGVRRNFEVSLHKAWKSADAGNANVMILSEKLNEKLLKSVKESSLVKRVSVFDAIQSSGTDAEKASDRNQYFLRKLSGGIRLFHEKADGFEKTIPALKKGEIYLPYGLRGKLLVETGDVINIVIAGKRYAFEIKGFVEEPVFGAMLIGCKQVFISDLDYEELCSGISDVVKLMCIYKADQKMSDAEFQRKLNLETGIIRHADGTLTLQQSGKYTGLYVEIITGVMIGFALVLFVIVLVVILHSIRTELEMDYVNLGILKSLGFSDKKLTEVLLLRYFFAELFGILFGILVSIPAERLMSGLFLKITAILPTKGLDIFKSFFFLFGILFLSVFTVFLCTRRLASISPVRAISGGRKEIYFSSRLQMGIRKKALLYTIAFRNITTEKKKQFGILFITAFLTFFVVTVSGMGNMLKSRSSMEAMGFYIDDIEISFKNVKAGEKKGEIEKLVQKHAKICRKDYMTDIYASLNGENLFLQIYEYPKDMLGIIRGRAPLYANEIVITDMVSEELGIGMGDMVTVSEGDASEKYLISGIFQGMNDAGMAFSMSLEGAKRIGVKQVVFMGMVLEEGVSKEKKEMIVKELNETFGDFIAAEGYEMGEENTSDDVFMLAANAMQWMVYAFSAIFVLVAVLMFCTKAFLQERIDIGIYKAIGFSAGRLRLQFALRFFLLSLFGGGIGAVAGFFFSSDVLNLIFRLFGISRVAEEHSPFILVGAILFISVCVFLFSFLAAGRVKRVEVRELIVE